MVIAPTSDHRSLSSSFHKPWMFSKDLSEHLKRKKKRKFISSLSWQQNISCSHSQLGGWRYCWRQLYLSSGYLSERAVHLLQLRKQFIFNINLNTHKVCEITKLFFLVFERLYKQSCTGVITTGKHCVPFEFLHTNKRDVPTAVRHYPISACVAHTAKFHNELLQLIYDRGRVGG